VSDNQKLHIKKLSDFQPKHIEINQQDGKISTIFCTKWFKKKVLPAYEKMKSL